MEPERSVRLRGAPVIHDTIDNETIAINQRTGRYYSLDGAAVVVWQALEHGAPVPAIVALLAARYDADRSELESAVMGFLDELRAEELVVDGVTGGTSPAAPASAISSMSAGDGRPPFPGLVLHQYTDMEVLLLADPIHEVDESGWPTPQPTPKA